MIRLGAVAMMVPDYDSGIAFYTAIGFELTADLDQGRKRWVTMRAPGGGSELVLAVGTDRPMERVAQFLHTDDFDAAAATIRAAGGTFEEEPRDEPYGRVAVWRDPFGNRWDLIEPQD